jgi:hypothetical protein
MLQGWRPKIVTILLYHDCTRLVEIRNLLTTWDKQCEHKLLTACWQTCYKMWDFCICVYYMHAEYYMYAYFGRDLSIKFIQHFFTGKPVNRPSLWTRKVFWKIYSNTNRVWHYWRNLGNDCLVHRRDTSQDLVLSW